MTDDEKEEALKGLAKDMAAIAEENREEIEENVKMLVDTGFTEEIARAQIVMPVVFTASIMARFSSLHAETANTMLSGLMSVGEA